MLYNVDRMWHVAALVANEKLCVFEEEELQLKIQKVMMLAIVLANATNKQIIITDCAVIASSSSSST